ncbi:MAG: type IV pilus twitching motility protein PilT [Candidatus Omnitrophica bacterium]|nr:type IV pilus twitching motility protein PilT [Candidatus Omnitrophota bacterium]
MADGNIAELLQAAAQQQASDLHLATGSPPILRVHGTLRPMSAPALTPDSARALISQVLTPPDLATWEQERDVDCAYELSGVARFRVNAFWERQGPGAAFRLIPFQIKSVKELGLPDNLVKFTEYRKGLCLVTGATGSGKSSTLAALIDHINRTRADHILTIEDPIEFVHPNQKSLVTQREVGYHTRSFSVALRAALREDPDVILVGEMRDLETIELALTAAETGHLVFGTLHTNSAADSVDRVINVFPANQQAQIRHILSTVLIGVISQNLLTRADRSGRVAAIEIMLCNQSIASLIREAKTFQIPSMMQVGRKEGMQTMDQALTSLLQENKVLPEEAYQYAREKEQVVKRLTGLAN